jgi:DNA-binding MarR family transcriptional regulator
MLNSFQEGTLEKEKNTTEELTQLLALIFLKVGAHKTKTGSRLGLTNLQLEALEWIAEHDGSALGALAEARYYLRPTATRLADALEKEQLIERRPDPEDRRSVKLFITEKGKEAIMKVRSEISSILEEILTFMEERDQKALLLGLKALIEADKKLDQKREKKK